MLTIYVLEFAELSVFSDPVFTKLSEKVETEALLTVLLYVHQLQNLYFAITHEELTLKEKLSKRIKT